MERFRLALFSLTLILAALVAFSCGTGSPNQDPLVSVTLTPATAEARDFANGQVQFVATGYYINPTRTVSPLAAAWGTCYQEAATTEISVTAGGVAQCAPGAVGTFTVWADAPPLPNVACNAITACGGGCFVAGTAQLTCP